jgi:hypothetical protein
MKIPEGTTVQTRLRVRTTSLVILTASLLLTGGLLAACGGSKAASTGQAQPAGSQAGQAGQAGQASQGGFGGGQQPGAFGTLADISGNTLQVQNPSTGQVSVTYSASTAFTQTKTVTAAAVKVGDCVTAMGQRSTSSSSAAPSSAAARPTTFPAATVQITAAVNGSCTAGGFGGNRTGARPSGSGLPTNRPTASPSGSGATSRGGFGGIGNFASGKVTAVSAGSLSIQSDARGQQTSTSYTVTLTAATTYTDNVAATSAALKVGECVTATGKSNSTGAVAATRIGLSTASAGGCSTGFARRPAGSSSTGA